MKMDCLFETDYGICERLNCLEKLSEQSIIKKCIKTYLETDNSRIYIDCMITNR